MRRLIALLVASLVSLLWGSMALAEPVSSVPVAHAFAHDVRGYNQDPHGVSTERGPPAVRVRVGTSTDQRTVSHWPGGAPARPTITVADAVTTYDLDRLLAHVATDGSSTGGGDRGTHGDLWRFEQSNAAAEGGSEVLLDTSAVKARAAAWGLMKPGECAVICSTVQREAAEQGFSAAGLPVVADGTSAVLRGQVAAQLRGFGAAAQGLENDAIIGATALERGIPLITGDRALWNAVIKLGGDARWFAPGG